MGETLVKAKFGLPNIRGQASVDILYEQSQARGLGSNSSAKVIDFAATYSSSLAELPADTAGKTVTNLATGDIFFTTLPPHLRSRFWFDGSKLNFNGRFVEEFGLEEPVGYLLLNVISKRDFVYLRELSRETPFLSALTNLQNQAASVRSATITTLPDNLALTAGLARSTGYVTVAFNNIVDPRGKPADRGDPVSLDIIRVTCPNYVGDVKVIYSEDPFSEDVVLRHSGDFAGVADRYEFQWQGHEGPGKPAVDSASWVVPDLIEQGGSDQLIRGAGRRSLADWWYRCRWRSTNVSFPCGTDWSRWTEPALAEGWVKRVLAKINFFDQKYDNLSASEVDTLVNVISQAGARWIGATPLDAAQAVKFGLAEIYETVLQRGIGLSIDGTPAIDDDGANKALLLAAAQLANIYMLLGNEAYADAADPTIGFVTTGGQYGEEATTVHCFMDQVGSLMEEELALLRGLDDSNGRVVNGHPLYNRLGPNMFSGAQAEPAYVLNYDITTDRNGDGPIDATDAALTWPQGHGDAWGHYLMAIKNFYRLLQNPKFTWTVSIEFVKLTSGLGDIPVSYQHERKFAQIAAAKARTGAEIVNLTYRNQYVEDTAQKYHAFVDGDTNRAWGVNDWASRTGQGAFFDWVVGNALLPPTSTETGIAKVDRTTVTDLREVVGGFTDIQAKLDQADSGVNPLGIAKNVVPFDISPQGIDANTTHYEQIYQRSITALANAKAVFNHANASVQKLREQAEDLKTFEDTVQEKERDFKSRLIEIFGYPYPQDPGYAGNVDVPDLYHYMYNDYSEITGETRPPSKEFTVNFTELDVDTHGVITKTERPVTYQAAANGFGVVKPSFWTLPRRAPGKLQVDHSELLQATAGFKRSILAYDSLLKKIEASAELIRTHYRVNSEEIRILSAGANVQNTLNAQIATARSLQFLFQTGARIATLVGDAAAEAIPTEATDSAAPARGAAKLAGVVAGEIFSGLAGVAGLAELDSQQAKERAQSQDNIEITTLRQEPGIEQDLAELAQLIRDESSSRLDLYSQQQALQQLSGQYAATLASGQRLLEERLSFRQKTAREIQLYRYKDLAFRIFRNENLQRFRAQFDLAARYVYLAAAAYDYETNLRSKDQGPNDSRTAADTLMTDIVRARSIGVFDGGPQPGPGEGHRGDGGLAASLWKMNNSWENYIKGPLGFNNPDLQEITFSIRSGLFRSATNNLGSKTWRDWLTSYKVPNMLGLSEFKRYCKPPGSGLLPVEPAIVIPFSTSIHFGHNFFGWPEVGGGGNFLPSHFATKIRSTKVQFVGYDSRFGSLSPTPSVYLIPVGNDVLRVPVSSGLSGPVPTREWKILDQFIPPPVSLNGLNTNLWQAASWIPFEHLDTSGYPADDRADETPIRRYALMPAFHDGNNSPADLGGYSRLIGRSVWNTRWMLIIPAGTLRADRIEALRIFIDGLAGDGEGVGDILLTFKVYSVSG